MTAREKFQKGDRVKLTQYAKDSHIGFRVGSARGPLVEEGVVVGFGKGINGPELVRVVFDGTKTSHTLMMAFVEKV